MQHALLTHRDVGCVGKVYESSQHLGADVSQGHLGGGTLPEAAGEHGSEVRAAGGQNHLVHLNGDRNKGAAANIGRTEELWPSELSSGFDGSLSRVQRLTSHLEVHRLVLVRDVQHQVTEQLLLPELLHHLQGPGGVSLHRVVQITGPVHGGDRDS